MADRKISELTVAGALPADALFPILAPSAGLTEDKNQAVPVPVAGAALGRYTTAINAALLEVGIEAVEEDRYVVLSFGNSELAAGAFALYRPEDGAPRLVYCDAYDASAPAAANTWKEFGTGEVTVPDFNVAEAVAADTVRAFVVEGGRRLWRATTALNPLDYPPAFEVPAPGSGAEWEELSPAETAGARLIYVSQAQARTMVAASDAVDQLQPGTLYRINARAGRAGGEHVVALAVTSRALHPVAALVAYDAGTDEETVSAILYTLNESGADTVTALGAGGGGGGASTFAALTGAPRANALLDADFSGVEDAVATKASRAGDTFTGNVFLPATADTSATRAVARGEVVTLIAAAGGSGYTAGSGLALTGTTFSLNLASANTWSAAQTFSVAPVLSFATAPGAGTLRILAINSSKQVVDAQPVYAQIVTSEVTLLNRLTTPANWDATGYWIPGTPEIDDIGRWCIVSISGTEYMIRIDAAGIPQRGKWLRI